MCNLYIVWLILYLASTRYGTNARYISEEQDISHSGDSVLESEKRLENGTVNAEHFSERQHTKQNIPHSDDEGGTVVKDLEKGTIVFKKSESPYIVKNDLTVGPDSKLIIEPGVEVKMYPRAGITVRGILVAEGFDRLPIIFTSIIKPKQTLYANAHKIRLVDGPSILAGRVQVFQHGKWHSLCAPSNNWTQEDYRVACQQLGFEGGKFFKFFGKEDKQMPRVAFDRPNCDGTEITLLDCDWISHSLGGGSCDGHPDLGIECSMYHRQTHNAEKHWKGLRFEHAKSKMRIVEGTRRELTSYSRLSYVYIRFAGVGSNYSAVPALEIIGVPPEIKKTSVIHCMYNGIDIIMPNTTVNLYSVSSINNRGFGLYIRSYDPVNLSSCSISSNGADGIKFIHQERTKLEYMNDPGFKDLCTFLQSDTQTYPIYLKAVLEKHSGSYGKCFAVLETQPGQKLTISFLQMWRNATNDNTAIIKILDGGHMNDPILTKFYIKNEMKEQSIVSSKNRILIQFEVKPNTSASVFIKMSTSKGKYSDLTLVSTKAETNNGHGVSIENPLSMLTLLKSYFWNNSIAGINVLNGVADLTIMNSYIIFNKASGINLFHLNGRIIMSDSVISSNTGSGFAIQFSEETDPPYIVYNETMLVRDSQFIKNSEYGLVIKNACSKIFVNLTRNVLLKNGNNALDIKPCLKYNNIINILLKKNDFKENLMFDIKMEPAINIEGVIMNNSFSYNTHGCVLIRNRGNGHSNLPFNLTIKDNNFIFNNGTFVVNIGLSSSSKIQSLLFTRNTVMNNLIHEPYAASKLVARNKVKAVIIVNSNNVAIYRNIIENPLSAYEIGTHLENPNTVINCTYNWLGHQEEYKLVHRIFDRTDRYNLAQLDCIPALINRSISYDTRTISIRTFRQHFISFENHIGGELRDTLTLRKGTYIVQRDIHVLPGGKLVLQPGTVLRFPPSIGMLVSGKLEALGTSDERVVLTLDDGDNESSPNMATEIKVRNVRLVGGRNSLEGLLLVHVGNRWGMVCNHGWTIANTAIICHSLGYVVNPNDWRIKKKDISNIRRSYHILLSNVQCNEDHVDIMDCKMETKMEFQNSCSHEDVVAVRCYPQRWAGIRFGAQAERSQLQFVTVEKAGLFDYSTNSLSAAIQMDFAHHILNFTNIQNNLYNGLEILYPDVYSENLNMVRNCTLQNNVGNGISIHHVGLQISGSEVSYNKLAGIYYSPSTTVLQQKELVNFLKVQESYSMENTQHNSSSTTIVIPDQESGAVNIGTGNTLFIMTEGTGTRPIERRFQIMCDPTHILGVQILNPINLKSTEKILIYNSNDSNTAVTVWSIKENFMMFPKAINSSKLLLHYDSGKNALGGAVLAISAVPAWPSEFITRRLQSLETLIVHENKLIGNKNAIMASYFARRQNEEAAFAGKLMEIIEISSCTLSDSKQEVVYVDSSNFDTTFNLKTTFKISHSSISNNEKGILHTSRIHDKSTTSFHWDLQNNIIDSNAGSFELNFPYEWKSKSSLNHSIHSVFFIQNTFKNNKHFGFKIAGGYADINVIKNVFYNNLCRTGLITVQGMEKNIFVSRNTIFQNKANSIMEFKVDSQKEGTIKTPKFELNEIKGNNFGKASCIKNKVINKEYGNFTSVLKFHGIQKAKVYKNLFANNCMDFNIIAEIKTMKLDDFLDAKENWWGSADEEFISNRILDFDDWNNHILVEFRPYLVEDAFNAPLSDVKHSSKKSIDNIDGRIFGNLVLKSRKQPYIARRDITVMPNASLTIEPGVVILFAPNIGIKVLGSLKVMGKKGEEVHMLPLQSEEGQMMNKQWGDDQQSEISTIRLHAGLENVFLNSSEIGGTVQLGEGFLQFYDNITRKWLPTCDNDFTNKDAKVVCRELGFSPKNAYLDYEWSADLPAVIDQLLWPTAPKCKGDEASIEDCPVAAYIRSGQRLVACKQDSLFVYIYCEEKKPAIKLRHWGGIRFARSEFEDYNQINPEMNHAVGQKVSLMQHVIILGAGALHSEKTPCIQIISQPVSVHETNITACMHDGISIISSVYDTHLFHNSIEAANGTGIQIMSLTEDAWEENILIPWQNLNLQYHLFGIHVCDTAKVVTVKEKILVHFAYDDHPTVCTKIFRTASENKTLGFRFLQLNLFNLPEEDGVLIFDGDIRKTSFTLIKSIKENSSIDWPFVYTTGCSLSIQVFISNTTKGAGFIAEVITLPVIANESRKNPQNNISSCVIRKNTEGGIKVSGLNCDMKIEGNRITSNCRNMPQEPIICKAAVVIDVQKTSSIVFKNNFLEANQGGLLIEASSSNFATALKGWIANNVFFENIMYPALHIEGSKENTTQKMQIWRNYFIENYATNTIIINEVPSNFSYNAVTYNSGAYILNVCAHKEFYPTKQLLAEGNYIYMNEASSTIFACTPEQVYVENILINPGSAYEMTSANASQYGNYTITSINAQNNWWGLNTTEDLKSRILDYSVHSNNMPIDFEPFYDTVDQMRHACPLGSNTIKGTCYLYIGAPVTFSEADSFCKKFNYSLSASTKRNFRLLEFLEEEENKNYISDPFWVQKYNFGNECIIFSGKELMTESCKEVHSFICTDDDFDYNSVEGSSRWRLLLFILPFVIIVLLIIIPKKLYFRRHYQERVDSQTELLELDEICGAHNAEMHNAATEENNENVPLNQDTQSEAGSDDRRHEAAVDIDFNNGYECVRFTRGHRFSVRAHLDKIGEDEEEEELQLNQDTQSETGSDDRRHEPDVDIDFNHVYECVRFIPEHRFNVRSHLDRISEEEEEEEDDNGSGVEYAKIDFRSKSNAEIKEEQDSEYESIHFIDRPTLSIETNENLEDDGSVRLSTTSVLRFKDDACETDASLKEIAEAEDKGGEDYDLKVLNWLFTNASDGIEDDADQAYEMVECRGHESNDEGSNQMADNVYNENNIEHENNNAEEAASVECENEEKYMETAL